MAKKPSWETFITDLTHMQTRAHALGLHQTGKKLNETLNVAGFEQAKKVEAERRIQKAASGIGESGS